jgi:ABC-2 type transport system permease protein
MGSIESLIRELKFALRDRVVLICLIGATLLSSYSLVVGLQESASEHAMIERTKNLVTQDREYNLSKQSDVGGAAYYAFHFTYDPPSSLAFVSRGIRDDLPWKHRIRMLALEGQIYETDAGNPELSKIGKLDFAFVAAFLLPLLSILLLYDLRAVEIRNNRWAFLSVTAGNGNRLLLGRALLRSSLLYLALIAPFIVASVTNGVTFPSALLVIGVVALNCIFWLLLAFFVFTRIESGPTTAALLLGCWFLLTVAIPVGGKYAIEQYITVPKGGEILLTQREAVNDAWDLPKDATMSPFIESHPLWANTAKVTQPFEWKWYYAFQQVGDQSVEQLSKALRSGIISRDKAMSSVALMSPPLLTERLLSYAGKTDVASFQRYDNCVREFHLKLREFHYPMLFGDVKYSSQKMTELPTFKTCVEAYE